MPALVLGVPRGLRASVDLLAHSACQRASGASRRMLVISNPHATSVSARFKDLVVGALRRRHAIEAVDTRARGHATALARDAAGAGFDVVVAVGGDGTVNEVINGLAGSSTALACLPGGATNVYCRMLGLSLDVLAATEHLVRLADCWAPRRIDVAQVNGRRFAFSSGLGLDASVVKRVDAHPRLKARWGPWYFTYAAIATFGQRYLHNPPRLRVEVGSRALDGVTAVVQNGRPFTFFGPRPVQIARDVHLQSGTLGGGVLQRPSAIDAPTLLWRGLSQRRPLVEHRRVRGFDGVRELRARSLDERPVALQVDGDFIGEVEVAEYSVLPGGLQVLA